MTDPDESQEFIKATKMGKVDKKASSSNAEANQQQLAKKPFDKKKWRENKYSHKAKGTDDPLVILKIEPIRIRRSRYKNLCVSSYPKTICPPVRHTNS